MKKLVSLFLAVAMLLCTLPVANAASHGFTDVPDSSWYSSYVEYVYANNLMKGMSDTAFQPQAKMSRAMLVTVLHRIAGTPETDFKPPFTDVVEGKWFTTPIAWAYSAGVVKGVTDTTFCPNKNVSREQMVTIIYRYAGASGLDVSGTADMSKYSDAGSISKYATDAFAWAISAGIITGTSKTELSPKGDATRAQCAAILQRFDMWIENPTDPSTPSEPSTTEQQNALAEALSYLDIFPMSYEELVDQLEYDGYSHEAAIFAADHCGANWTEQALKSAISYLDFTAFSYTGLYDQLIYEKFTSEQAQYAVDHCGANWTEQALKSALNYLETMSFSYDGLYDQLIYEDFTEEQARYGVDNCGADWNEQAVKCASNYLRYGSFSRAELINQLEYEGFTHEQAVYGVTQNGL